VAKFEAFSAQGFKDDADKAADELCRQVGPDADQGGLLLIFPDGILGNCRQLIESLERQLPDTVAIAGGTAGDLLKFERTYQYHGRSVLSGGVSALLISGDFDVELTVSHGCDLIGRPQVVTRAADGYVHEIDGEPAWDVFRSYLPDDSNGLEAVHVAHLLLAEHIDEADAQFGEYSVRVPVRLERDTGALYFAAGLDEGTEVQLALRNAEKVCSRAIEAAEGMMRRRQGQAPSLVMQLDCAGRGRLLFDEAVSESLIVPVQQAIGEDLPWIGLHTYGEIAPVGRRTYFHNYTGVLCALYPKRADG
jgi:methyl-accepting chemotaxis protein